MGTPLPRRASALLTLLVVPSLALAGCSGTKDGSTSPSASTTTPAAGTGANMSGCITSGEFDKDKDYFGDKATFTGARNVHVSYHKSYKVLTLGKQDKPSQTFVLLQCGAPRPTLTGELAKAPIIDVPVKRVAASSTTQIPVLHTLGSLDAVVGVNQLEQIYRGPARDALEARNTPSYGSSRMQIDTEKLISLKPDAVLAASSEVKEFKQVQSAGIPVLQDLDYLESTPLARAEWMKTYGILLNKEGAATKNFDGITKRYTEVAKKARNTTDKPSVLVGQETKGQWYVPGTDSYMIRFMTDAGATDAMSQAVKGSGATPTDAEVVFKYGSKADFWLNGNYMSMTTWHGKDDALKQNPRYANLSAFQHGNVWNPSKRTAPDTGNDFWQSGIIQPDVVLADLTYIFHPDLMKGYTPYYYTKLS